MISGDRIQGFKLRHFGKLKFIYHGELRRHSGSSTAAPYTYRVQQWTSLSRWETFFSLVYYFDQRLECAAPKRWLKYTTYGSFIKRVSHVLRLVYCGSYIKEGSIGAVDKLQYTRGSFSPLNTAAPHPLRRLCGMSRCTAVWVLLYSPWFWYLKTLPRKI